MLGIFTFNQAVSALPTGYEVIQGTATFEQTGSTLNVTASADSIINYASFNIDANETVNFLLPSFDAFSLNRVLGSDPSQIMGGLNANGNLILVNANGFYFGQTAQVNTAGLIASTHDIANANFLSGNYLFEGSSAELSSASILNEGLIQAQQGGFAVLIGDAIENRGTIQAPMGTVALAAGKVVTVGLSQDGLISIGVNEATAQTILDKDGNPIADQIKNTGTLSALGGSVQLTAKALDQIFESAINLEGVVMADGMGEGLDGKIAMVASHDLNIGEDAQLTAGSITLHTDSDLTTLGTLVANDEIRLEAFDGTLKSRGSMSANMEDGLIIFKAETLDLGGNYAASFIDFDPVNIYIDTAINTTGAVTFTATNDIYVNANITTTSGTLTFTADSDSDNQGSYIQSAGTLVRTITSGDITITGAGATVGQMNSVGTITVWKNGASDGMTGDILVFDDLTAGGNVRLNTAANLTIQDNITAAGSLTLRADHSGSVLDDGVGDLIFANAPTLQAGATSVHNIKGANAMTINGSTLTVGGQSATLSQGNYLQLTSNGASGSITVSGVVSESAGIALVSRNGGVAINADLTASSGDIYISADDNLDGTGDFSLTNGLTFQAGAASGHTFRAANALAINGTTLTVGGQTATLSQGTTLSMTSTGASGSITVSGAVTETGAVTLISYDGGIGTNAGITSSGHVTITADADNDGTGNLTLSGTPTIQAGAASNHTINAANAMDINGTTLTIGGQTATLSQGEELSLTSTGSSGSITVSGAVTETGRIILQSYDGGIAVNAGLTSSSNGNFIIDADFDNDGTGNLTLSNTPTLTAGASGVHMIKAANALDINGTTLTVGGNTATLSQGTSLQLTSTGSSGSITVSGAVTETNRITLQSYDGGININAGVSGTGSNTTLTINADYDNDGVGDLTFSNTPTLTAAANGTHSIKAANAMDISGVTLTVGGQTAQFSQGTNLSLTSTGASGSITVSGVVGYITTLQSYDGGIAVNGGLFGNGAVIIDADYDNDGTGNLTLSGNPTIQAAAASSHTIKAANALDINGTTLTVGGNTATLSQGTSLSLTSTGASGSVTVSGTVTETGTITLQSYDGGIVMNAGLTGGGDLTINADFDSDGTGNLTLSGTPTIQAVGDHIIKAANALDINGTTLTVGAQTAMLSQGTGLSLTSTGSSGSITVSGATTETSAISLTSYDGGIDVQANLTGSRLTLTADNDSDGIGNFTHTGGTMSGSTAYVTITGVNISLGAISANSGNSNITVTASGNITSNNNDFTALNTILKSTGGNIGTASAPITAGAGDYIDAQAPTGTVYLSQSGATVTVRFSAVSGGLTDTGWDTGSASYGSQNQRVGSNLRYLFEPTYPLPAPASLSDATITAVTEVLNTIQNNMGNVPAPAAGGEPMMITIEETVMSAPESVMPGESLESAPVSEVTEENNIQGEETAETFSETELEAELKSGEDQKKDAAEETPEEENKNSSEDPETEESGSDESGDKDSSGDPNGDPTKGRWDSFKQANPEKVKTVVIVHEGSVMVKKYNQKGEAIEQGMLLMPGMQRSLKGAGEKK